VNSTCSEEFLNGMVSKFCPAIVDNFERGNPMAHMPEKGSFFPVFLRRGIFFELLPQRAKCKSDTCIKSAICKLLLKILLADSAVESWVLYLQFNYRHFHHIN
jgi:hypothetical protein